MAKVKVTVECIRAGKQRQPCHCPVAIALRDAGFKHPSVQQTMFSYCYVKDQKRCKDLPVEARQFIADFDSGKKVDPFEFNV